MKKDVYKLTNPQKNILEMEQVNSGNNSINHILSILKLSGKLNTEILEKTIKIIIEKNDSFHINIEKINESYKQYFSKPNIFYIEKYFIENDDISKIINLYQKLELGLKKLYAFGLVFTSNFTYVIYKAHHIISDGWGMTQVGEQIKEIYSKLIKGEELANYNKPSYINLIKREEKYLESSKYNLDMKFWDEYTKNLDIPHLFNNSDIFKKDANRIEYLIPKSISEKIDCFCSNNSISEYCFFLAIYAIYFKKIYNVNPMVFGTPFLNRLKKYNDFECTGLYVCNLPLNISVTSCTDFLSLCKNINSSNLSLFRHSSFPYHKIENLYHKNTHNTDSLFEVGFSYQINESQNSLSNGDKGEYTWYFSKKQNNPLTIHLTILNHEKQLSYDYLKSCFNEKQIKQMNEIIFHIITQILNGKTEIKNIDIIPKSAYEIISKFNNSGDIIRKDTNVIEIFEKIVQKYQQKTAIICGEEKISYKKLYNKTCTLANYLQKNGLKKGMAVALFFDKSIEMIISILAVLKSGGCYVPILPDEEEKRIEYILNDCKPFCILTNKKHKDKIKGNIICIEEIDLSKQENCDTNIMPNDIAYIIYTSGSTGNPKGTMVMHKNICGLIESISQDKITKAKSNDICMSLLKYSFDASGIDIYTALLFLSILLLVEKQDELNPKKVLSLIEKYKVTRSFLIPKWLEHIASYDENSKYDLSSLRILGSGGEVLKPHLIESLLKKYPKLKILNLYGPTEATMFTTCKKVKKEDIKKNHLTIGRPIYGSRLAIINSDLEFLPPNIPGELIIYEDNKSIQNIAKGYLNLPKQTEKKFINIYNPIIKEMVRAYRTGDMAKLTDTGEIEFIGRDDDVVKVNGGYLVALNEVEKKIQNILGNTFEIYPVAIPFKNTKIIILFITKKEKNIALYNIKNHINDNISFYMRPKKIIELEELPRNSSGKIDRKKLIEIAKNYLEDTKHSIKLPETKTEKEIYKIIKKFVDLRTISITDDFIDDLGIDSLDLNNVYTELKKYNISIQDIYNNPCIKDLADFIDKNVNAKIIPNLEKINEAKILNNVKPFNLEKILLTGVTGFLGIHLLRELLINKNVKKIYCIIRNKINLTSEQRLNNMIKYYFNSDNNIIKLVKQKVIVLNGDITKKYLGIDEHTYKKLKNNITTVINSAANVRHFVKPEKIKKDNVESVNYLIDFCGTNISLAHISTLSIAGFKNKNTKNTIYSENNLYINQEFNNNPYLISKFEAEKNILYANNYKKLNSIIFRMGNIMPRLSDGVFQQNANQNVFLLAIKSILDCKMIPKEFLNTKIEFSPVDECANIIISILQKNYKNSVYHILNNNEITILELKTLLNDLGCDILETNLEKFKTELVKYTDEYTKEYLLSQNLNKYTQEVSLKLIEKCDKYWHKTDIDYINNILKIIKTLR